MTKFKNQNFTKLKTWQKKAKKLKCDKTINLNCHKTYYVILWKEEEKKSEANIGTKLDN